jgi:hypothetical protein
MMVKAAYLPGPGPVSVRESWASAVSAEVPSGRACRLPGGAESRSCSERRLGSQGSSSMGELAKSSTYRDRRGCMLGVWGA